jgi:hypothetical protein
MDFGIAKNAKIILWRTVKNARIVFHLADPAPAEGRK